VLSDRQICLACWKHTEEGRAYTRKKVAESRSRARAKAKAAGKLNGQSAPLSVNEEANRSKY
jgi:hypothetical protein